MSRTDREPPPLRRMSRAIREEFKGDPGLHLFDRVERDDGWWYVSRITQMGEPALWTQIEWTPDTSSPGAS